MVFHVHGDFGGGSCEVQTILTQPLCAGKKRSNRLLLLRDCSIHCGTAPFKCGSFVVLCGGSLVGRSNLHS